MRPTKHVQTYEIFNNIIYVQIFEGVFAADLNHLAKEVLTSRREEPFSPITEKADSKS